MRIRVTEKNIESKKYSTKSLVVNNDPKYTGERGSDKLQMIIITSNN